MQTLLELASHYGPIAIFLGTFLEGETMVIVGGFLAHHGTLDPVTVAVSAFAGSFVGDQFWFFLGRRHADRALVKGVTRNPAFKNVVSAIEDHPRKFILSFRFFYGLRIVSPIAVGLTEIPARQFFIFNLISGVLWSVTFTAVGYLGGKAIESILGEVKKFESLALAAAGLALGVFAIYQVGAWLRRRARKD